MIYFGSFIYGDASGALRPRMKESDGTYRDVTAATSIVLRWAAPNGTTGTISGTVVAPGSNGTFLFPGIASVVQPEAGRTAPIDFVVEWLESATQCKSRDVGRYDIRRFP